MVSATDRNLSIPTSEIDAGRINPGNPQYFVVDCLSLLLVRFLQLESKTVCEDGSKNVPIL
jgi:hypothetical protein